jgi:hypothetical protein
MTNLVVDMIALVIQHKKKIIIVLAVIILNLIYGFDERFTIINLIWLLV